MSEASKEKNSKKVPHAPVTEGGNVYFQLRREKCLVSKKLGFIIEAITGIGVVVAADTSL